MPLSLKLAATARGRPDLQLHFLDVRASWHCAAGGSPSGCGNNTAGGRALQCPPVVLSFPRPASGDGAASFLQRTGSLLLLQVLHADAASLWMRRLALSGVASAAAQAVYAAASHAQQRRRCRPTAADSDGQVDSNVSGGVREDCGSPGCGSNTASRSSSSSSGSGDITANISSNANANNCRQLAAANAWAIGRWLARSARDASAPAAALLAAGWLWQHAAPQSHHIARCVVALLAVAADYNRVGREAALGRIAPGKGVQPTDRDAFAGFFVAALL